MLLNPFPPGRDNVGDRAAHLVYSNANSTRLRPFRFAEYRAASARVTRSLKTGTAVPLEAGNSKAGCDAESVAGSAEVRSVRLLFGIVMIEGELGAAAVLAGLAPFPPA